MYFIFFIICFGAPILGAICGICGGVIIKPVFDAFGIMNVETISFLSGCTVLSMTTYSVISEKLSGESYVEGKIGLPLAIGAVLGGILGKLEFQYILSFSENKDKVGAIQAVCLLIVTIGTLLYTVYKEEIKTYKINNTLFCIIIGTFLGILSSFLGVGGGPINLVILFFFFSMSTKTATENSLYIIFFSQIASLIQSIMTVSVPLFKIGILIIMASGGILGGICGRALNMNMKEEIVDKLFIGLMVVMILINIYNIYKFM